MARVDHPGPTAEHRLRRWRFPVLLLAMFVVLFANAGINLLVAPVPALAFPVGIGLAVGIVICYRWLCRTVEGRPEVPELATTGMWRPLRRGALLGFCLFTTLMLLIAMFGGWDHVAWGSFGFVGTIGLTASVAVAEETLYRGVLFRIMEERTGTVFALVASSLIFGLTHMVNSGATLWGTLSIALTGGFLITAAYVLTRSLWLPIGLHFAWDFTHAGVFGAALSGSGSHPGSLLHVTLSGPSVLTGGAFGPEASLFALLVCLVPTVYLLRKAVRAGRLVRRTRPAEVTGGHR